MVDVGRDIVENEPIPSLVGRHSRAIGGALEPTLVQRWCSATSEREAAPSWCCSAREKAKRTSGGKTGM